MGFQESEEEFEETRKFLEEISFYEMHIFKFSSGKEQEPQSWKVRILEKDKTETQQYFAGHGEKNNPGNSDSVILAKKKRYPAGGEEGNSGTGILDWSHKRICQGRLSIRMKTAAINWCLAGLKVH